MRTKSSVDRPGPRGLVFTLLAAIGLGCGSRDDGPALAVESAPIPGDPETIGEIRAALDEALNQAESKYKPLKYDYDEGLMKAADQIEAHLSGKADGPVPRFMPKLDEVEELDHFRETIRRWEAKTGRNFRASIDPLVAEVAARVPNAAVPPDFHKRFGAVFDSFIPIEVQEARERRDRQIRSGSEELLAKYRDAHPETVKYFEEMIARQYPGTQAPPERPAP